MRGVNSREHFDPALVERDLGVIARDLHCTAVRVIGGDAERIALAGRYAADLGLEVWFSPYPLESTTDEMLARCRRCQSPMVATSAFE